MPSSQYSKHLFVFSQLWAFATLFHLITFLRWDGYKFLGLIVAAACIAHLVFRKHYYFFMMALIVNVIFTFLKLPEIANHLFYEWLMNVTILFTIGGYLLLHYLKKPTSVSFPDNVWVTLKPVLKVSFIILYLFVVFHKLNTDFFSVDLSCGANFFTGMLEQYKLLKIGFIRDFHTNYYSLLRNFSIYFTIVSEGLIPVLLVTRRFRRIGILYGILFHLILGFYIHLGVFSFSCIMYVYYVVFFDDETIEWFYKILQNQKWITAITLFILVANIVGYILLEHTHFYELGIALFLMMACLYFYHYGRLLLRTSFIQKTDESRAKYFHFTVVLVPIVVVANGLCPYFGLKTETSYAMFSNIRTENGSTNHFFMPVSLQFFNYQNELVTIVESTMPHSQIYVDNNTNMKMVFTELKRLLHKYNTDFYVKFEYQGKVYRVAKTGGKLESVEGSIDVDQSALANRFLFFRPVYLDQNYCQH